MSQMDYHSELKHDIEFVDPGIEPRVTTTSWGHTVTLFRQGHSTKWRIWLFADGSSRITKPRTATLPEVDCRYLPGAYMDLRENLTYFIQSGWI